MTFDDKFITQALDKTVSHTSLNLGTKINGKVRDIYDLGEELLLVTTDRLSAFDRNLTTIPFKGQVLNQISRYWFNRTKHIVANHMIDTPYANAMRVKNLKVFPIEFVVRGYITGSTNTSLWTLYHNGLRNVSGIVLPEGLEKNSKLPKPLLTPTTKSNFGDAPIEQEDILASNLMSEKDWEMASRIAFKLYEYGSEEALKKDFILVDTKFELGKDEHGNIFVLDELLTPDSSRYWRASNLAQRKSCGLAPDNFDKDIVRAWYKNNCDPYKDKKLPEAPDELRVKLASAYINFYELITGEIFDINQTQLIENTTTLI